MAKTKSNATKKNNNKRETSKDDKKRTTTTADSAEDENVANKSKNNKRLKTRGKLPVTLLSGFLGAGKTTLLKYILEKESSNRKIAVIVNDMAELNIDEALISQTDFIQTEETLVSMQNGCVCCSLSDDLQRQIIQLSEKADIDYMIIEASGVAEPAEVAKLFQDCSTLDAEGGGLVPGHDHAKHSHDVLLSDVARLDCCVTVVDAAHFYENVESIKPDTESVPKLIVEQIETANVILLNKMDLLVPSLRQDDDDDKDDHNSKEVKGSVSLRKEIRDQVTLLNDQADVIETTNSRVEDLSKILDTKLFDFDKMNGLTNNKDQFVVDGDFIENNNNNNNKKDKSKEDERSEEKSCCASMKEKGGSPCCRQEREEQPQSADKKSCCASSIAKGEEPCCGGSSSSGKASSSCSSKSNTTTSCSRILKTTKSQIILSKKKSNSKTSSNENNETRHGSRFGITSILYQARRPFHPVKFHESFISKYFVWVEEKGAGDDEAHDDDDDDDEEEENGSTVEASNKKQNNEKDDYEEEKKEEDVVVDDEDKRNQQQQQQQEQQDEGRRLKEVRIQQFGNVLRMKGFVWLANMHDLMGVLQMAGNMISVETPQPWFVLNKDAWTFMMNNNNKKKNTIGEKGNDDDVDNDDVDDKKKKTYMMEQQQRKRYDKLRKDFIIPYGDRRQELVIIGQNLNVTTIQKVLDDCLLTDNEFEYGVDYWKATIGDTFLDDDDDDDDSSNIEDNDDDNEKEKEDAVER